MSVGPSSPLPGAQGPGAGKSGRPAVAASPGGRSPFLLLVPSPPPPPPHLTPPARSARRAVRTPLPRPHSARLSRRGCRREKRSARACRDRRMDGSGQGEDASVRARALSPPFARAPGPAMTLQPPPLPPPRPPRTPPPPSLPLPSFAFPRARQPLQRLLEGPERVHLPGGCSSALLRGEDRALRRKTAVKVPADGDEARDLGRGAGRPPRPIAVSPQPGQPVVRWVERRSR